MADIPVGTIEAKNEIAVLTADNSYTAGAGNVCLESNDLLRWTMFTIMSRLGGFTVEVSLDGTNWCSAHALSDLGAATTTPVLAGVAGKCYGFGGVFKKIRVKQDGGTQVQDLTVLASQSRG